MSGEKNLKFLESKYFRIIYSQKSEKSAFILYENADAIYEKIASFYGRNIQYKMPVVITSQVEQMNAYWTSYPYNHIVLYDTYCIESLTVFKQNLLSVFTHELTHAFTFNLKGPFWNGVDKIFGDCVNFSALWVTGGIAEGATVFTESYLNPGEGRLNDEFTKHLVKQSKIENKFPSFFDCQGARNAYPYGSFYIYNGMFTEYLYKKYGMEKYAEFWYRLVNGKTISLRTAFKKMYGNKLKNEWKSFEKSIDVDSVTVEDDFDLLGISKAKSKINNKTQVFQGLSSTENAFFVLDESDSSIWMFEKDSMRSKKVFSMHGIQDFSVSSDSRYLAFSFFSTDSPTIKSKIGIFDLEKKTTFVIARNNLFNPAIFFDNDLYYFAATSYSDSVYSSHLFKIEIDEKGFIKDTREIFSMEHEVDSLVFDYDFNDGKLSFVKQKYLKFSFCSIENDELREITLPEEIYQRNFRLRHVSYFRGQENSGDRICFTWTQKNSMERFGFYDVDKGQIYLDQTDLSGGVYFPVFLDDDKIVYVGKFFDGDVIYLRELVSLQKNLSQIDVEEKIGVCVSNDSFSLLDSEKSYGLIVRRYYGSPYYLKGINFPLSLVESESYPLPFGLTHISSSPWSKGNLTLSAGYGIATNSFGFLCKYSSGTDTSLFAYNLALTSEFDFSGWKREEFEGNFSSYVPFAKHSAFSFGLSSVVDYGYINSYSSDYSIFKLNSAVLDDFHLYLNTIDSLVVSYSNLRYVGSSLHGKAGIVLSSYIYYIFKLCAPYDYQVMDQRYEAGFTAKVYSPGFAPYSKDSNQYEYTVPFKLIFSVLPASTSDIFLFQNCYFLPGEIAPLSIVLLSYSAVFTLFSMQIQKAIPVFTFLYLNNFSVYLTSYGLAYDQNTSGSSFHFLELPVYFAGEKPLLQNYFAGVRLECVFSPNIGQTTNSGVVFRTFAEFSAELYSSSISYPFVFSFGLATSY